MIQLKKSFIVTLAPYQIRSKALIVKLRPSLYMWYLSQFWFPFSDLNKRVRRHCIVIHSVEFDLLKVESNV